MSDKEANQYTEKDLRGSAFFIKYKGKKFIVTNNHVKKLVPKTGFSFNSKSGLIGIFDDSDLNEC